MHYYIQEKRKSNDNHLKEVKKMKTKKNENNK